MILSPACQECLQSGVTDPTFPQPRHSSIGTEPSACSLSIISSKNSMHHDRFLGQYLIPTQLGSLNRDTTSKICNAYFNDFSDREVFDTEILRWKKRWALAEGEKPNSLVDTLSSISEDLYPNVATVLTILLAVPVSTATRKRSFSTMRRVKTYMRSTMLTKRLSSLAVMHAYIEMPIDLERVTRDFCASKPRRLAFELSNR